jgi:hypothetical protein
MNGSVRIIQRKVRLHISPRARKSPLDTKSGGPIPRITRLMALAVYFEQLLERGAARNYAELARRANLSRARVTQVMKLRLLAPDIQETLLSLPPTTDRHHRITERDLRPIVAQPDWRRQRLLWQKIYRA